MPKKTTIQEIVDSMLKNNIKIIDNSICGKCSKCGECCSNFLPISQTELDIIQAYVIKHNIKPQMQMLIMQNRLSCPYYNGKKCLIYEVRPLICEEFYCYKKPNIEMAKKFQNDKYYTVNMWEIAKEIEKERRKNNEKK